MSKFYGKVGYIVTEEAAKGVFIEKPIEREYYGDILRMTSKWESGESINDDLHLSNRISILGDPFAYEHFSSMRYVVLGGARWKITNVEVSYPRLTLSIGGVYNNGNESS